MVELWEEEKGKNITQRAQRREGARIRRRPLQRLGEFAGGSDAPGFGDAYGLVGGDVGELVELPAGPVDFEGVGLGVLGEAEG